MEGYLNAILTFSVNKCTHICAQSEPRFETH